MKLTNDLIDNLLDTKTELQFIKIIFNNRIEIEEWQNCEKVFHHYQKLHEKALGEFDPNIADDIPEFCRLNKKNDSL